MATQERRKPQLWIICKNGNAFNVLASALKAARKAGWSQDEIDAFREEATNGDYDHLLSVCMDRFDVN